MEAALEQIEQYAASTDDIGRQNLRVRLRKIADSTEGIVTTIDRFGHKHLECAAVKIGCDLNIFKLLAKSQQPLNAADLAKMISAEPNFLSRLMRYHAGLGNVDEVSRDLHIANRITKNLADDLTLPGISHYFETCGPLHQSLPGWLKNNKYNSPTDGLNTVFQNAFNTSLSIRPWLAQQPANMGYLMDYVRLRGPPSPSWLSIYPDINGQTANWPESQPVFVELNGHFEVQATQFNRFFLSSSGIEKIAYNLLQSVPVRGAKFYYTQRVFHNLAPEDARSLLLLIKEAMVPESRLLIDEAIPPEVGADYLASAIDLTMLEAFAAIERTESQWRRLLEDVGLELVKTHVYNECIYESVIEVRLR